MKARGWVLIAIIVILVAGALALAAWTARPRLLETSPQPGGLNVPATASIQLHFSRPMQHASVESRLKIDPSTQGVISWEQNTLIFTPDQPWQAGQAVHLRLEAGAKAASWLAFPMDARELTFTPSTAALAYLWPASGPADIYALDPVTGAIRQYTHGMNVLDYSANRDGNKLYFSAGNSGAGIDLYQVDRLQADRSPDQLYQPQKLLDCGEAQCRNPVVSPDGKTLAYEYLLATLPGGLGRVQVWTLSLPELYASPAGQASHETVQPGWSSAGLLAYYDRTISAYEVYNPASQSRTQLPNQTGQPGAWSPDGQSYLAPEIVYQSSGQGYETGSSHLLRYSIQAGSHADISGNGDVEDTEAVYSPDGSSIAFARKYLDAARWSLGRQLWIMNSDGSNSHAITGEPDDNHYDLAWSRDGSALAYVSFNQAQLSTPPELWMVSVDGSDPTQLVIGGYSPIWIP